MDTEMVCPRCGRSDARIAVERVKPDMGAGFRVGYVLALILIFWQGFERLGRPYTTQSAYNVAVAIAVVAVVLIVAMTVYFVRAPRAREVRVLHCPGCGHAEVLDKKVLGSRGWKLG